MNKCQKCKIEYPNGYLSPLITSKGSLLVCGICALEIGNEVLGIKRKKFNGEEAERLRQMAIQYRKKTNVSIQL